MSKTHRRLQVFCNSILRWNGSHMPVFPRAPIINWPKNISREKQDRFSLSASVEVMKAAFVCWKEVELFSHVSNIGDSRSLILHPASTTHRQLTDEQRLTAGAGPEVIRLSVGIESAEDLIADLEQALEGL